MSADYLRVSVTDRCNLRCVYCCPADHCKWLAPDEILSFEEISRIVRQFAACGIRKVRLTGGEPLVRSDLSSLVARLRAIEAVEELALTTNGILLERQAQSLKDAGLNRVNISIDSLDPQNYRAITGCDGLAQALKGIDRALAVGLDGVKLNCVVIRDLNMSQILPLARMSVDRPLEVRFIEYCPTGDHIHLGDDFVSAAAIRKIIEAEYGPLMAAPAHRRQGPALRYRIAGAEGTIGFICGRSTLFCQNCNRIRLTSEGMIRPCLHSARQYNIKQVIRSGAGDGRIRSLIRKILDEKRRYTRLSASFSDFNMHKIGG